MKVSYNWLKDYLKCDLSPEEIAAALTSIGLEVDAVEEVEEIPGGVAVKMIDGGALLAYSEKKPSKILCDGEELDFNFGHRRLEVTVPEGKETTLYFIY